MLRRVMALSCVVAAAAACGPRKPMDGKGSVLFWVVTDSAVTFANCADDPQFRSSFTAIPLQSLFVYRLAKDGQSATGQDCQRICDSTGACEQQLTCADNDKLFQVANDQLLLSQSLTDAITNTNPVCSLDQARDWEVTDKGTTLAMAINDTLTLSGDMTSCNQVNQSEIGASPDGKGVEGCVVNFTATAAYTTSP